MVVVLVVVGLVVVGLGVIMNFHCPLSELCWAVAPPRAICSPSSCLILGSMHQEADSSLALFYLKGTLGRDPDKPLPSNGICWGPKEGERDRERQR